jgi:Signal transduction histidine kinase regulating citrate/malate metabolism
MQEQIRSLKSKLKNSISWGLAAAVLCGLLLLTFATFYFSAYQNPYMQKNMTDISDGWQYGIGSEAAENPMPVLHQVDVSADEILTITRVLYESFPDAALMLKSNHQRLRIFLDEILLFESPYNPAMKNPGMGLHFIPLPLGYEGKLLHIELTSPYTSYSGAPSSVFLGDIPSLETYALFYRSLPHKLLMVCCLAAGIFMMSLALVQRKQDKNWCGNFCFGIFSVLFSFYLPSSDFVSYQLFSPVWVSHISIGLYFLYPVPLMLYFNLQFMRFRRAFLPASLSMVTFAVVAFGLQLAGIRDFPELLNIYNPLYVLCSVYLIALGFAQIKNGGRFIRFTVPWLTLVFLISIQSMISFYTTHVKQDETLYELAIFTLIVVVWLHNIWKYLRTRAQEQRTLLELRMRNQLILQSHQNTTKHLGEVAVIRHEMKNHVVVLRILLDNGEHEQATDYLLRLSEQQDQLLRVQYCEHYLLNAILNVCLFRLQEAGVRVSAQVATKEPNLPIEDLSSLVINILDNAEEALAGMEPGADKWLELNIRTQGLYLYIFCKNAKTNAIIKIGETYLSSKRNQRSPGQGLKIIRRIVKKHDGLLNITHTENTFSIEAAVKNEVT